MSRFLNSEPYTLSNNLSKVIYLKTAGYLATSVVPDQTPHSAASDLDLHWLHMLSVRIDLGEYVMPN